MGLLGFFSKFIQEAREATAAAREAEQIPLPHPSYESVFHFIRMSCGGWMSKDQVASVQPSDELVRADRFSPSDVGYWADGVCDGSTS